MEQKSNEATPQRPGGDRVLDAPMVMMDIDKFIDTLKSEPTWKDSDRNSITIYKSQAITIVLVGLHKDAEMKTHTADGPITVQVIEGSIKFTAQTGTEELEKKQMVAVHARIPHSVVALKESYFLLTVFHTRD